MANSVDLDQTAPLAAVWYGSALFVQAYLSENLGSLWYTNLWHSQTLCHNSSDSQVKCMCHKIVMFE